MQVWDNIDLKDIYIYIYIYIIYRFEGYKGDNLDLNHLNKCNGTTRFEKCTKWMTTYKVNWRIRSNLKKCLSLLYL